MNGLEAFASFDPIWSDFANKQPTDRRIPAASSHESHGNPSPFSRSLSLPRHRAHGEFSSRRIIVQASEWRRREGSLTNCGPELTFPSVPPKHHGEFESSRSLAKVQVLNPYVFLIHAPGSLYSGTTPTDVNSYKRTCKRSSIQTNNCLGSRK